MSENMDESQIEVIFGDGSILRQANNAMQVVYKDDQCQMSKKVYVKVSEVRELCVLVMYCKSLCIGLYTS